MDVNLILKNTISDLSLYKHQSVEAKTELKIPSNIMGGGSKEASVQDIDSIITSLNHAASSVDNRVSFTYNEKTNRIVMKIMNPETSEVVKQIPSQEIIRLLENINEMVGVFVDKKV